MAYERDSQEDLVWDSGQGEYVPAAGEEYTLTISPTPNDATVTLTATGYTQSGNSITVVDGTTVSYSVAKSGYTTQYGAVVVTETSTIAVTLTVARLIVEESSIGTTVYDIHGKATKNKNPAVGADEYVYNWVGTLAEYTAQDVEHTHPDWVCLITDDGSAGDSGTYVRNALIAVLSELYPVGSLYFGTQSTCPLTTLIPGSTWVLVAQDRSIQGSSTSHAAGTTIEAGLPTHTHDEYFAFSEGIRPLGNAYGGTEQTGTTKVITENITHVSNDSVGKLQTGNPSNSIYGASNTVQPAVYVSNIWERTS